MLVYAVRPAVEERLGGSSSWAMRLDQHFVGERRAKMCAKMWQGDAVLSFNLPGDGVMGYIWVYCKDI